MKRTPRRQALARCDIPIEPLEQLQRWGLSAFAELTIFPGSTLANLPMRVAWVIPYPRFQMEREAFQQGLQRKEKTDGK